MSETEVSKTEVSKIEVPKIEVSKIEVSEHEKQKSKRERRNSKLFYLVRKCTLVWDSKSEYQGLGVRRLFIL